ncbi:hypothetical protein ABBQ38_001417 [Trebouxia sp. C0009 RCD-2024]
MQSLTAGSRLAVGFSKMSRQQVLLSTPPRHVRTLALTGAEDRNKSLRRTPQVQTLAATSSTQVVLNLRKDLTDSSFDDLQAEAILKVCDKALPEVARIADLNIVQEQLTSALKIAQEKLTSNLNLAEERLTSKSDLVKEHLSSRMNLWFVGLLLVDFLTAVGSAGPDSPIGKFLQPCLSSCWDEIHR